MIAEMLTIEKVGSFFFKIIVFAKKSSILLYQHRSVHNIYKIFLHTWPGLNFRSTHTNGTKGSILLFSRERRSVFIYLYEPNGKLIFYNKKSDFDCCKKI